MIDRFSSKRRKIEIPRITIMRESREIREEKKEKERKR